MLPPPGLLVQLQWEGPHLRPALGEPLGDPGPVPLASLSFLFNTRNFHSYRSVRSAAGDQLGQPKQKNATSNCSLCDL